MFDRGAVVKQLRFWFYRFRIWIKLFPRLSSSFNGRLNLTPFQQYFALGGDELHFSGRQKAVLVLGGFLGESALRWSRVADKVLVYEPVPQFFQELEKRLYGLENVSLSMRAVGPENGEVELSLYGDGTSINKLTPSPELVKVEVEDISALVRSRGPFSTVEMNVEGAEFAILKRLVESGEISGCHTLLIQFHNHFPSAIEEREQLRQSFSRTHNLVWSFDWVWERWDLKPRS